MDVYAIIKMEPNNKIIALPPILDKSLPVIIDESIWLKGIIPITNPTQMISIPLSLAFNG